MNHYLVTGGAGFIGSHLVSAALQRGAHVTVLDDLSTGNLDNLAHLQGKPALRFVQGSILNRELVNELCQNVDSVFHFAAKISVPESIKDPVNYVETNTIGTLNLLNACVANHVDNFVLSSSAAVYGDDPTVPKQEHMSPAPMSPYAVSKLDGEYYCQQYRNNYKLNATALRYFNVYGPRQNPNSAYAAAIPTFISQALNNQPLTIFGDGKQTRDFIFVADVVNANLLACQHGGDILNIATGDSCSINDLARTIVALTESSSSIVLKPPRAGDIDHSFADQAKTQTQLAFKSATDLQSGLRETIQYFAAQRK